MSCVFPEAFDFKAYFEYAFVQLDPKPLLGWLYDIITWPCQLDYVILIYLHTFYKYVKYNNK